MARRPQRWGWIGALLWLLSMQPSAACTLWGAAGSAVNGGGTLVAKNRDGVPDHRQELVVLNPQQGYRVLALRAVGGAEPGFKAGVNEKGLVIVSATAGQVPAGQRRAVQPKREWMRHFLTTCASVDELLSALDRLNRPVFYLAGDRHEIALIEVAPDGRRSVHRRGSGTLHHTNHYCALEAPDLKRKPGASSRQRYDRAGALLRDPPTPFGIEDFIRISQDAVAGPDKSIWRTGGDGVRKRTLATWLVSVPTAGSPQLYLKTADPGGPERVCRLSVDEALRPGGRDRIPLDGEPCR